eukprot:scaffold683_cov124-Cylindrotheca_fusiformis.AAC.21
MRELKISVFSWPAFPSVHVLGHRGNGRNPHMGEDAKDDEDDKDDEDEDDNDDDDEDFSKASLPKNTMGGISISGSLSIL